MRSGNILILVTCWKSYLMWFLYERIVFYYAVSLYHVIFKCAYSSLIYQTIDIFCWPLLCKLKIVIGCWALKSCCCTSFNNCSISHTVGYIYGKIKKPKCVWRSFIKKRRLPNKWLAKNTYTNRISTSRENVDFFYTLC